MGTKIGIDTDTLAQMITDISQREVDKRVKPLRRMMRVQLMIASALLVASLILGVFGHVEAFRLAGVSFFVLVGWMVPVWVKSDTSPVVVSARFIPNEDWLEIMETPKSDIDK